MRQAFQRFVRGLFASALCVASSIAASAAASADESVVRLPSVGRELRAAPVDDEPLLVRGQRSFRLVQFDDPSDHQPSPSDFRRPSSKTKSSRATTVDPEPDPEFYDERYVAEYYETCEDDVHDWADNTEAFFLADSYKGIGDSLGLTSLNNSFGARAGLNTAVGLGDSPYRFQFGGSYGAYDLKGRPGPAFDSSLEEQIYVTAGVYRRSDVCNGCRLSWGLVLDNFFVERWGAFAQTFDLQQVRGQVGYAVDPLNELGGWAALSIDRDSADTISSLGAQTQVQAMDQFNVYWKHHWENGGDSVMYAGMIENADLGDWVVGASLRAPLSPQFAAYGGFAYVGPHSGTGSFGVAEEAWNVTFGLLWYPGCKAMNDNVSGQKGMPLLPVAGNGTFLITP